MRKSFTRLLGLIMLFCTMSLFAVAVAPTLTTPVLPLAATNVDNRAGTVTVTMTFNQNVVPGAAGVGIIALSTDPAGVQLDPIQINGTVSTNVVTGSTATISNNVVTVVFRDVLTEGATYRITVTSDALRNGTNEYFAGIVGGNWTLTIADYTKPALIATVAPAGPPVRLTPADEATAVVLGNVFTAVFTERLAFGTGNIGLYTQAGDVVEIFEINQTTPVVINDAGDFNAAPAAGKVSIDLDNSLGLGGNTLYIQPTLPLVELQKYYVRIAPTAIVDVSVNANAFLGINDNTTWNFWAQDITKPLGALTAGVAPVAPATMHTDVARLEKPTILFTDNGQIGLYPQTLTLKRAGGAALVVNTDYAGVIFTMTEDPLGAPPAAGYATFTAKYKGNNQFEFVSTAANGWTSDAVYQITLVAATVEDNQANANVLATFDFTAGDFTPPTFPTADAKASGANGDVGPDAGADHNANTATKLNETKLYLIVNTADVSLAPYCVVKYLVVPNTTVVTVNDVVTNGVVLPRYVTAAGGAISATWHEGYVTTDHTGATLASNTLYDVHYIATDNATNPNTSTALTSVIGVRTNDILAPTAVVTTVGEGGVPASVTIPAGGSVTNVKEDGVITITFNEPINFLAGPLIPAGSITVEYYDPATSTWGALATPADYTPAINGLHTIITVTPVHRDVAITGSPNGWRSSANYRVKINASTINDDIAGNAPKTGSDNVLAAATYTFTTEDFEGPISTFKASDALTTALHARTNVIKTANLIITLSETLLDPWGAPVTNATVKDHVTVRKGDGTGVTVGSPEIADADLGMTIVGNVITIDPVNNFDTETWYGVWVDTDCKDDEGTKLNKYQDNTTAISWPATYSELATFKAIDSRSPLVDIKIRNAANTTTTVVMTNVESDAMPIFVIDEQVVTTIGGGTAIAALDGNQIRSLIQLRRNDANGEIVNFNVVDVDATPAVPYGEPAASTVIKIDPIDYPAAYSYVNSGVYYVSISGLQDAFGNPIATYSETFTAINAAALTRTITPAVNAVQVGTFPGGTGNIVITFDRNVNKVAAPMQLTIDADGLDNTTGLAMVVGAAMDGDFDIDISTGNAAVTVVNNVVTIPYAGLAANTQYRVFMMAGAFTAADNVAVTSAVINAASAHRFTTLDAQGPQVILTNGGGGTPMGALSSPVTGAKLTLDFDEEVFLGTGVIYIKRAEVGVANTIASIDLASANFTWPLDVTPAFDRTVIDVNIPATLEYATKYIVEIPATAFKDHHNNPWEWLDANAVPTVADDAYGNRAVTAWPFVGAYVLGTSVWDFETIADPTPTYDLAGAMVPLQAADDVPLTTGLTIAFSEPMSLNTVGGPYNLSISDAAHAFPASLYTIDLSTVGLTWSANNTKVTISGSSVIDLLDNENYWINITAGAFKSATNQLIPALTSAVAANWYFTTTDNTRPVISSVEYTATNNRLQVDVDGNIIVHFSEPVEPVANWQTSITIAGLTLGAGNFTMATNNMDLTINPLDAEMIENTTFTITLVAGQTRDIVVAPAVANTNLVDVSKTFVVEDNTAPVFTGRIALEPNSLTSVRADVTVTDGFTVGGTAPDDIKVYYLITADGAYTTNPSAAVVMAGNTTFDVETATLLTKTFTGLTASSQYDIYLVAVDKSRNLNQSAVVKVNETTTAPGELLATIDDVKPTILGFTPADGTINVDTKAPLANVNFKITWSEKVALNTAITPKAVIRKMSDNTLVYKADRTGGAGIAIMTVGGTPTTNMIVSFDVPIANFLSDTEYYIELENGLVTDQSQTDIFSTVADNVTDEVIIGNTRWNFRTSDKIGLNLIANTLPSVGPVALSPLDLPNAEATPVSVVAAGNPLVMIFDEPVVINRTTASNIEIYRVGGGATPHEIIPVSSLLDVVLGTDGKTVTINRHNTYASEENYYVNVDANAFYDAATPANNYAGILFPDNTTWNFTTADITVPGTRFLYDDAITQIATGVTVNSLVDINGGVKIKFWDSVAGAYENLFKDGAAAPADLSSYIQVIRTGGVVVPTTSAYAAGVITITPTAPAAFVSNEHYTVTITGGTGTGALEDDAANEIGTSSVTFDTEDRLSPTVTFTPTLSNPTTPNAEAKLASRFRITFNKNIVNDGGLTNNIAPTKAEMEVVGDYFTFQNVTGAPVNVPYTINVITAGLVYEIVPTTALTSENDYELVWVADPSVVGTKRVKDIVFVPGGNPLDIPVAADRTFDITSEDGINPLRDGLTPATTIPLTIVNPDDVLTISFNEQVMANDAAGAIQIRYSNGQIFDEILPSACDFSDVATFDVVITPNRLFDAHREYFVEIPAGAFTDDSYNTNPYAGFTTNVVWKFKTDDGLAPTVASFSPLDDSYDIPVNSNLVINFSENIVLGAAGKQFVIYFSNGDAFPVNDGNAMEIITLPSAQVTVSGSNPADPMHTSDVVTINPAMTFDFNPPGQYYIRIDNGFVTDLAGAPNSYLGIHDKTTWNFNITNPTRPALVSFTPLNGATGVPQTITGATMTFDRDILTGTGYIRLYQYYYNSSTYSWDTRQIEAINVNTATIDHTTYTATFNVATRLLDNTVYYFLADNGTFTNTASSHDWYTGLTDPFTWRFTTAQDLTAPVLDGPLATAVTNFGATCLNPNTVTLGLNFTEANGIQIGTGGLKIYTATGTLVTTVPVSAAVITGNNITFTVPAAVLADKTEYYVMLDGTAVKDNAVVPNFFDSSVIAANDWKFYTGDFTAPVLDAFTPVNGTNNLANSVTLTMNFSEPVQPGTEPLVVTRLDNSQVVYNAVLTAEQISGSVATVTLTSLVDSKTYQVSFGAGLVKDLAYTSNAVECGNLNNLAALGTTWQFSIDDNAVPTLVGLPIGTNAPGTVNITITASEAVTPVAGKMVTLTATGHTPIEILAIDLITTDNLVFTKSVAGLADLTTYTVAVASGAFIDAAVVANATEAISWNFTTGDNTAPTVTETTPTGTIATYIGTVLTITFDEPVLKNTGNITIGAMSIPVSSENVSVTNNVVTITPTSNLGFLPYTVTVPAGAFKDGNNNLSALTTWTFSIVDSAFNSSCMSATHFTPFDETLGVARNINLVITFCEKVVAGTGNVRVSEMVTVGTALYTDYPVTSGMISTDGLTLTLPITGLVDNTRYGVTIQNGAIKDEAGNAWEGISDVTFWNFTAGDNTAPTVTTTPNTLTNATNAFDVAMVFDENVVNVNSTNVTVSSGTVVVTGSGSSYNARITAADGAVVTLTIGGGIKDASERNSLVPVTRTYTVGDNTAPTLTVTAPATPVTTTFTVGLTFNEPVTIPAGAIVLTGYTNFVLSETDASHYTLTITSLEETTVTIDIPNTIVDNSSNHNAFAGTTLSYTVGDFTAPTVTAAPASGTSMLASFNVVLTFSPDAIVTAAGITVTGATTTNITNVGNVFTVAITAPDNTTVTVTAANTIADEAGNLLAGTRVFTYTTGDNTRPTVVVDPVAANDTVNVFDLTMVFSEHVTIPTGAISVNTPATITYSLLAGNVYNAVITAPDLTTVVMTLSNAIVDDAGNTLTPVTFTYTIGDHTAPTLSNHFPATAEVITNNHPTLEMVFDETVVLGTGFVRITKVGATTPSVTIPITLGTISANTVSLTYDAAIHGGLDRNANYFVTIDAGAVNDASGNAYAGLSSATAWTFTTGPDWVTPVEPVIDSLKDIYPNPFADFITVSDASKLSKVVITSITGQKVKEVVNPTERIQTSELRSGIYIVSLYVNDAVAKTQRIVKR